MPDEFPLEVLKLHAALERLAGVRDLNSSIQCIDGVTAEQLSLPGYFAQLPHGAMRRTGGAVANEVLVQVEFRIDPSPAGWRSLEFLAWWIRDLARGRLPIQMRPFALPPTVGSRVQLGRTLRFQLDYFFTHPARDIETILVAIDSLADDLQQTIDLYEFSFLKRGDTSLFLTEQCPESLRLAFHELLYHSMIWIRSRSLDSKLVFALADHVHNIPSLLSHFKADLLKYYWEIGRPCFLRTLPHGVSAPKVFEPLWATIEQEYHRLCKPVLEET